MPTYIYTFVTHNFNFNKMEQENINVETPQEQNEEQKEQQVFTENVTTETTEQEPSDSVVEDDDFLSQILNQEDEPSEPKGEDPEIAEAKNYKSLIEQDDFLKQVIAAKKAGADIKEVVNQFLSPDYSESEPERVFKDYLRREDSNLSEDELDYEYANFIGDRENLSIVQKKTIRDWAKYLNENKPKNDWTKIAVEREEIMKRASQKTNELINDLNGQRIMARRNDLGQLEGGYVFDADSVKRTEKVAKAIADFFHQHMQGRLLSLDLQAERLIGGQMLKKIAQTMNRHEHHVVQTQARQRFKLGLGPANPVRHEPSGWRQHRIGAGLTAHAPQQAFALQTCAATVMAQRVRTVFGKQDAYVHLVRLGFQVFKETLHPIPLLVPLAVPVG